MSKKIILHLFTCIVFMQSAFSQVYFQPGTPYVYRSLSPAGNTSVLTLVFDTNGNATISKSQETSLETDQQSFYVVAPIEEVSASTYSDNNTGTVQVNGSTSKYWLVSFENPASNPLDDNSANLELIGGSLLIKANSVTIQ